MTPAELLAATAADMRAVAEASRPGPWTVGHSTEFYGSVSACVMMPFGMGVEGATCGLTRYEPLGTEDGNTVEHIAAWDPGMACAVADWLDAKADRYSVPSAAESLDRDLASGFTPPMLKVCAAWWKSRGREPVAP